jgi:hypothetical protein
MARQCPHGHDGIEQGEVADDTSTKHPAHQAHISPWTRPSSSRASSRSPWPRSPSFGGEGGCERTGRNRLVLADRRNRRRLIYRLSIVSAADSGGAHRNRARRWRGDAVTRGSAREKTTRVSVEGKRPVGPTEPLVGFDQ